MSSLAEQFARYAEHLSFADLPREVVHEVKRRVIDSLACAYGAFQAEPCVAARKVASTFSAQKGATLLGTRHRAPPDWAAFANGCLVRYLDFNDTYLSKEPAHPSDNIPAALAVAEAAGRTGEDLILAIVLSYEVQCRLCDAASLRARGWDHVTYGAFSTALAAAGLLRLDLLQTRHALQIAGVASAALRQSRVGELSHWKGCAFANAARHGVFSALLASAGITGPAPIFEGDLGFEKLVSGPMKTDVAQWGSAREGRDFMILNTSIKFWPAEYHAQSAIEAAFLLRKWAGNPEHIESILIESHDAAVDIIGSEPEKWHPRHRETADHSLPYLVAVALADGEVTSKQFTAERLADPKLHQLVQRVRVERNKELSRLYPQAVANIVAVQMSDGRRQTVRLDYPHGHRRNPLTDAEVEAKFHSLADSVLGMQGANAVLDCAWKLEQQHDLSQLLTLLELPFHAPANVPSND